MKELKGSEKQIKWAEDIRKNILDDLKYWQKRASEKLTDEENQRNADIIAKLEAIEDASTWITIEKAVRPLNGLMIPARRQEAAESLKVFTGIEI